MIYPSPLEYLLQRVRDAERDLDEVMAATPSRAQWVIDAARARLQDARGDVTAFIHKPVPGPE